MTSSSYTTPGVAPTGATTSSHANSPQNTEHLLSVTQTTNQLNTVQCRPSAPSHVNSVLKQAHSE